MKKQIYKTCRCPNMQCWDNLHPSNAATNFNNPSLVVRLSIQKGILRKGQRILEIGSGNLRNALFVLQNVPSVSVYAFDFKETIERFFDQYSKFRKKGGRIVGPNYWRRTYHAVICTFVLETICPESNRFLVLKTMRASLAKGGVLIAAFRGYSGVRGTKYQACPLEEGFLTPHKTFVRPYSIPEVHNLLRTCGFRFTHLLQKYRVEKPQNIHVIALREVKYGKKLVGEVLH